MKRLQILFIGIIVLALAFACKKTETTNTDTTVATDTSVTSTSATDTSATMATSATDTATTATTDTSTAATSTVPLSDKDKDFVTSAGKGGMAEVALAQDAVNHATNPDVKAFAQKLIDDHTKANGELSSFASGHGVTIPSDLESKIKEVKERLLKLTGKSFDQAFVKQMVEDHKSTIKMFEDESKNGADTSLKTWVDSTLPTLKGHLKMAEDLQAKVGKK